MGFDLENALSGLGGSIAETGKANETARIADAAMRSKSDYEELRDRRAKDYAEQTRRSGGEYDYKVGQDRLKIEEGEVGSVANAAANKRRAERDKQARSDGLLSGRQGAPEFELGNGVTVVKGKSDGAYYTIDKDGNPLDSYNSLDELEKAGYSPAEKLAEEKSRSEIKFKESQARAQDAMAGWTESGRGKTGTSTKDADKAWDNASKGYSKYFENKDDMGNVKLDAVGQGAFRRMISLNRHSGADPDMAADSAINAIQKVRDKSTVGGVLDQKLYQQKLNALFSALDKPQKAEVSSSAPDGKPAPKKPDAPKAVQPNQKERSSTATSDDIARNKSAREKLQKTAEEKRDLERKKKMADQKKRADEADAFGKAFSTTRNR